MEFIDFCTPSNIIACGYVGSATTYVTFFVFVLKIYFNRIVHNLTLVK